MSETAVLVAMGESERRDRIETRLVDRPVDVLTTDDPIDAVDRVRWADVVLVGDYPEPIAAAVLDATTPPGVCRPNVYLSTTGVDGVAPDERLPADAAVDAVVDAVCSAVERAEYARRVAEFSSVAVEAATTDRGSAEHAERVAELAGDARAVQSNFSPTDWVAAFRSVATTRSVASSRSLASSRQYASSASQDGDRSNSGNRTS